MKKKIRILAWKKGLQPSHLTISCNLFRLCEATEIIKKFFYLTYTRPRLPWPVPITFLPHMAAMSQIMGL